MSVGRPAIDRHGHTTELAQSQRDMPNVDGSPRRVTTPIPQKQNGGLVDGVRLAGRGTAPGQVLASVLQTRSAGRPLGLKLTWGPPSSMLSRRKRDQMVDTHVKRKSRHWEHSSPNATGAPDPNDGTRNKSVSAQGSSLFSSHRTSVTYSCERLLSDMSHLSLGLAGEDNEGDGDVDVQGSRSPPTARRSDTLQPRELQLAVESLLQNNSLQHSIDNFILNDDECDTAMNVIQSPASQKSFKSLRSQRSRPSKPNRYGFCAERVDSTFTERFPDPLAPVDALFRLSSEQSEAGISGSKLLYVNGEISDKTPGSEKSRSILSSGSSTIKADTANSSSRQTPEKISPELPVQPDNTDVPKIHVKNNSRIASPKSSLKPSGLLDKPDTHKKRVESTNSSRKPSPMLSLKSSDLLSKDGNSSRKASPQSSLKPLGLHKADSNNSSSRKGLAKASPKLMGQPEKVNVSVLRAGSGNSSRQALTKCSAKESGPLRKVDVSVTQADSNTCSRKASAQSALKLLGRLNKADFLITRVDSSKCPPKPSAQPSLQLTGKPDTAIVSVTSPDTGQKPTKTTKHSPALSSKASVLVTRVDSNSSARKTYAKTFHKSDFQPDWVDIRALDGYQCCLPLPPNGALCLIRLPISSPMLSCLSPVPGTPDAGVCLPELSQCSDSARSSALTRDAAMMTYIPTENVDTQFCESVTWPAPKQDAATSPTTDSSTERYGRCQRSISKAFSIDIPSEYSETSDSVYLTAESVVTVPPECPPHKLPPSLYSLSDQSKNSQAGSFIVFSPYDTSCLYKHK